MYQIRELFERHKKTRQSRIMARNTTQAFIEKAHFRSLINSGMSPAEAARRLGLEVHPGEKMTETEVLDLIEKEYGGGG